MAMSKSTRILILLGIDSIFFLLELVVGYAVHSLALVADSFHMLNDVISLLVGLWAVKVAGQKTDSKRYTYGWQRAETLGALVNGVFLVALCLSIFLEAIQRFVEPQEVSRPKLVLVVGCFGLASNLLGLALFHDHSHGHGEHVHGHENGTADPSSLAEQGYAADAEQDVGSMANESGNIANILPQTVVGAWQKSSTQNDSKQPPKPTESVQSEHTSVTAVDSPQPKRRKTSSASASRVYTGHWRRRSGSHTRYASMGEEPENLHPARLRRGIIAAGSLESVPSVPTTESEGENDENDVAQATETQPLLQDSSKQDYVNGHNVRSRTRSSFDLGRTDAKHRQQKSSSQSHGHSHSDLNIRGIFLHVMGDALGNVGVIATALIIWLTDYSWRFYFDPFISLVITVIILLSAIPLCRAASRILLQAVPAGLDIDKIKEEIEQLRGVVSCHHVHVWQLSDTKLVASLHVQLGFDVEGAGKREYMRLAKEVQTLLHEEGIHSSTIQPEFCLDESHTHTPSAQSSENDQANIGSNPDACLLDCGDACVDATCCVPNSTVDVADGSPSDQRG